MVGGATAEAIFAAWMGRFLDVWYDFFLGLCGLWKLEKVICRVLEFGLDGRRA